jgi:hypothetical protein
MSAGRHLRRSFGRSKLGCFNGDGFFRVSKGSERDKCLVEGCKCVAEEIV